MAQPPGLKASPIGKITIREALEARGIRECRTVAEIRQDICNRFPISSDRCNHFVAASRPIKRELFISICQWLGVDWEEIIATPPVRASEPFYGRTQELDTIKSWVEHQDCRMVTVHGIDGIGKSSLVRKLRGTVSKSFRQDVWKTFSYGEPVEATLRDLLQLLKIPNPSNHTDLLDLKRLLLRELQQHKHLIILEQVQEGGFSEYEQYRELLSGLLGEYFDGRLHSSCILLITSYERFDGLTVKTSRSNLAKRWELQGVDPATALEILQDREPTLVTNERSTAELVRWFGGNPLSLKLVSYEIIRQRKSVQDFLRNPSVPNDIQHIIEILLKTLDRPALTILDILKDSNPISQAQIEEIYREQIPDSRNFIAAINTLERRYLLVKYEDKSDHEEYFGLAEVVKRVIQLYLARNT